VELGHRFGRRRADLLEGVLIVNEAVDDRGLRNAERRLAVIRRPRGLGDVREVVHALDVVDAVEMMLVVEVERGIERPTGDDIARSASVEPGVQRGVVFLRRGGREFDGDVGIVLVERRDDLAVPDVGVVVAPALDLERAGLSRRQPDRQRDQGDASARPRKTSLHPTLLIRRASCPSSN
jgi:hypothetical protein